MRLDLICPQIDLTHQLRHLPPAKVRPAWIGRARPAIQELQPVEPVDGTRVVAVVARTVGGLRVPDVVQMNAIQIVVLHYVENHVGRMLGHARMPGIDIACRDLAAAAHRHPHVVAGRPGTMQIEDVLGIPWGNRRKPDGSNREPGVNFDALGPGPLDQILQRIEPGGPDGVIGQRLQ